jgi:hypothetical protein
MQTSPKLNRLWKLALAAVLGFTLVSQARAEAPLRWKFKEGESLDYVIERAVDGKLNLSGADIEFKVKMIFDTTWKVKSVAADGTASVEETLDRMQVSMDSPLAGSLEYDSQTPTNPDSPAWSMMVEPMVNGMLGQTLKWKVSPLGKVTDIEMPEKLKETFAKQSQGGNRQAGLGLGGNMFSDRGIREFVEKSVQPLPETAGKDATWKQSFENPIPRIGTQMSETTFTFAEAETKDGKNLQKIASATELTFEPAEDAQADLEITSQSASGAVYFDPAAGRVVKAEGTQSSVMEISGARELIQEIKETTSMRMGKSPAAKPADKDGEKKEAEKKDAGK